MRQDFLHLKAPGNWINDPNGFIYYKDKYHLFYQHFPYAPMWGTMHWGHAVSEDLVHWNHEKIALFPTKSYDRNGVFSGSAIEKDGKMYLYYTANRYLKEQDENIHQADREYEESQAMIISEDGFHFDNWNGKKQIIPVKCGNKVEYEAVSGYCFADFDTETGKLELEDDYSLIDYGGDFYAQQTNLDKDGRRVMIGWIRMPEAVKEEKNYIARYQMQVKL